MKKMINGMKWCCVFTMILSILFCWNGLEEYHAATSYDNAMEFFHSTENGDGKHIEVVDGTIYFGTRAKLARTRSGHKYYNTLGYDVTLTANGKSVTFAVKRGGSLEEVPGSARVDASGYEYLLYRIPTNTIFNLASKADPVNAKEVLKASVIQVCMDAIVTIRQNGVQGNVMEDGKGGLTETAPVYHLKNNEELEEMREIFSGHMFASYIDIEDKLYNYELSVIYAVNGTPEHIEGASSTVTMASGYKRTTAVIDGVSVPYVLCTDSGPYKSTSRVVNEITILNPSTVSMDKIGYHLDSNKEWITAASVPVSANTQMSKEIAPDIGYGDRVMVLYANWKANQYQIIYNANGGQGTMTPTAMVYDVEKELRTNTFTRNGYKFLGWSTNPNATTPEYTKTQSVKNLTAVHGRQVILYAVWKPCVYEITTDKHGGTGGVDKFYEKHEQGFYSDKNTTNAISSITVPGIRGYTFTGYFKGINGGVPLIVNKDGKIQVAYDFFEADSVIHAAYQANQYKVFFDKQGGEDGSDFAIATFDLVFPQADAPRRDGYSFQGYFTEKEGKGTKIYSEFMVTDTVYTYDHDITLYAYWVDDVAPQLTFTADYNTWTKNEITLTAEAADYGSGLAEVKIFKINVDGSESEVAKMTESGKKELTLTHINTTEGIIRYRAIAADLKGNTVVAYAVVYYDTTAPTGSKVEAEADFGKLKLEFDVTDINPGE